MCLRPAVTTCSRYRQILTDAGYIAAEPWIADDGRDGRGDRVLVHNPGEVLSHATPRGCSGGRKRGGNKEDTRQRGIGIVCSNHPQTCQDDN